MEKAATWRVGKGPSYDEKRGLDLQIARRILFHPYKGKWPQGVKMCHGGENGATVFYASVLILQPYAALYSRRGKLLCIGFGI